MIRYSATDGLRPTIQERPKEPEPKTGRKDPDRLYDMLARAADNNELCPNNDTLVELFNLASGSSVVNLFHKLEKAGLITVERFMQGRVVTITATGKQTLRPANTTPHWRTRRPA